jgi:hypothetical protein
LPLGNIFKAPEFNFFLDPFVKADFRLRAEKIISAISLSLCLPGKRNIQIGCLQNYTYLSALSEHLPIVKEGAIFDSIFPLI